MLMYFYYCILFLLLLLLTKYSFFIEKTKHIKFVFHWIPWEEQLFHRSSPDKEAQYIQHSILPTMHFQDSLTQLPIPDLDKTCERYVTAIKPLVTPEELQSTIRIIERFKQEEGKELQDDLKKFNSENKHTSYISVPWLEFYLKTRQSLPLNCNPFLAMHDDPNPEYNTQLLRSTNMVISSLRFLKSLRDEVLEPEVYHQKPKESNTPLFRKIMRMIPKPFACYAAYLFKGYPLDMSQFKHLFCSTRIPHLERDELRLFPESRHLAVLKNGNFYVFDVLDINGNILPWNHIYNNINYIINDSQPTPTHSVCTLTTENRDTWAKARQHLEEIGNKGLLHRIDSALFVLVLHDDSFDGFENTNYARAMLYNPPYNRWFDKSFMLMITKNGKASLNFEHSWGDGLAVLRFCSDIGKDCNTHHLVGPETVASNEDSALFVKRLDFIVDEKAKLYIENAEQRFSDITSRFNVNLIFHKEMNKRNIQKFKLSPDSLIQLAVQMTCYKTFGKFMSVYEAASTSAFKHGRTETIRPVTAVSKRCVEEFCKENRVSDPDLRMMFSECSKNHNQLVKEAVMGQGFDRHLFGLNYIAEKMGKPTPKFFEDPTFIKANKFIISSSTMNSEKWEGGGFGPVDEDRISIGYCVFEKELRLIICSYKPYYEGDVLENALRQSLDEIYQFLSKT